MTREEQATARLDDDLADMAADLIRALRDESVPPAILDLAGQLQRALAARALEDAGDR
ncbi:hypothetical protein [Falsirhodobacter halotolerans]|uniref:hypothetical protein n=1 Tax=Falsirhodobacter halotolerans TaxID=1146892 RepID=UPI001FD449CF|nr:hypothetical protein [Falsirhodobacter halotolerans]MCJ8140374.1 hypothetical protein [Falsirhodobacter halotolerans]